MSGGKLLEGGSARNCLPRSTNGPEKSGTALVSWSGLFRYISKRVTGEHREIKQVIWSRIKTRMLVNDEK